MVESVSEDPVQQFDQWYQKALHDKKILHPDAFCLSTVSPEGFPEGRMLLLKDFGPRGFVFYTNQQSAKGRSLQASPQAAMTFYWEKFGRQVRIQGSTEGVSAQESDAYFRTRPRQSQLGAWASLQSEVLENRTILDQRMKQFTKKFKGKDVPRPSHWIGYRLVPATFEFWQERPNRLHDRFLYTRQGPTHWALARLYP